MITIRYANFTLVRLRERYKFACLYCSAAAAPSQAAEARKKRATSPSPFLLPCFSLVLRGRPAALRRVGRGGVHRRGALGPGSGLGAGAGAGAAFALRRRHRGVALGPRLALAGLLAVALLILAALHRDVILGLGLRLGELLAVLGRVLLLQLQLGLGDLLLAVGFLLADVLGVALERLAGVARGLVLAIDALLRRFRRGRRLVARLGRGRLLRISAAGKRQRDGHSHGLHAEFHRVSPIWVSQSPGIPRLIAMSMPGTKRLITRAKCPGGRKGPL